MSEESATRKSACRNDGTGPVLICFAVKEEARPLRERLGARPNVNILVTGMGRANAERAMRAELTRQLPRLVLTCGFAGGLRSELASGTVLFECDDTEMALAAALKSTGAQPARFHCAAAVATTADQKRALRETTRADAVEMESQVIRAVCRERNLPSATARVILDTADENLPLDFNRLMNSNQELSFFKLALALARSPGKIPALMRLQRQTQAAAEKLGEVLLKAIETLAIRPAHP
jgi:nucleoside phosphorylase